MHSRREVIGSAGIGIVVLAAGVATAANWVDWPALGQWLEPHAGAAVMIGIGVVLLTTAIVRAVRPAPRSRRGTPPALSWWLVATAAAVVAGVTWAATAWLLGEADQAVDKAAARVEAIKTGLTIGAGAGGVFALLLAVRRQWHQEINAAATEHDASERRVTELYTKAVEQLGSAQAPVRLGGLYALERVAQNTPEQRQTVVDVLCAYLRMPFTPPNTSPRRLGVRRPPRPGQPRRDAIPPPAPSTTSPGTAREELEVRLAAQRILTKHLQPGPPLITPIDTFWENIDLDLTGATLMDWDLKNCLVRNATFIETHFNGKTFFLATWFRGAARFNGARFNGDAWFSGAHFTGASSFTRTKFTGVAQFSNAQFTSVSVFAGIAQVGGHPQFHEAEFTGEAWFSEAQFMDGAWFTDAQFNRAAWFIRTRFRGDAWFTAAKFFGNARFTAAKFIRVARFTRTRFTSDAWFSEAQFSRDAWFGEAQFSGNAFIDNTRFARGVPPEIAALQAKPTAQDNAGDSAEPAP